MRRAAAFVLLLLCASVANAQTPTFVQSIDYEEYLTDTSLTTWVAKLPNGTQAGNALVAACYWRGSTTFAISDDKSNTWSVIKSVYDSTNNRNVEVARALNVTAGTQAITATMGTADGKQRCHVSEWYNIATSSADDGNGGRATTGTSICTGSWSTTTANDLIIFAGYLDDEPGLSAPMTWTAGSGFTLLEANGISYGAAQFQVRSATGSWSPCITSSYNATGALAVAMALKSATAGSAPAAGIHVNRIHSFGFGTTSLITGIPITAAFQIPSSGNLVAISYLSATGLKIQSLSSSPSNTWSSSPGCVDDSPMAASYCLWYAGNASTSAAMTVSITLPRALTTADFFMLTAWDVSGAATAPFDKSATATGVLNANSGTVNGPSLTPATANGVILLAADQNNQAVSTVSPGNQVSVKTNGVLQAFSLTFDHALGVYYNPSTAAYNSTITYYAPQGSATYVGDWWGIAAAFEAPAAGGSAPPPTQMSMGVGN
jgi:hypothetical protein